LRLVIFDVGGVVCENTDVAPAVSSFLNLSEEAFFTMAGMRNFRKLLGGEISEELFWEEYSLRAGRQVRRDLWSLFFKPVANEVVLGLVRTLRSSMRVVAGTNTFESHYAFLKNAGYYDVFDAVYASHMIGAVKPCTEFYWRILIAEDCPPSEAFFIDDSEDNVDAARRIGLSGHTYVDALRLKTELEKRGLVRPMGSAAP